MGVDRGTVGPSEGQGGRRAGHENGNSVLVHGGFFSLVHNGAHFARAGSIVLEKFYLFQSNIGQASPFLPTVTTILPSDRSPDKIGILLQPPIQIGRWIQPGKGEKVIDEMRLIKITATASDIGPVDRLFRMNAPEDLLKAANAAK